MLLKVGAGLPLIRKYPQPQPLVVVCIILRLLNRMQQTQNANAVASTATAKKVPPWPPATAARNPSPQDVLLREYHSIFPKGNRNTASHKLMGHISTTAGASNVQQQHNE